MCYVNVHVAYIGLASPHLSFSPSEHVSWDLSDLDLYIYLLFWQHGSASAQQGPGGFRPPVLSSDRPTRSFAEQPTSRPCPAPNLVMETLAQTQPVSGAISHSHEG